MNDELQLRQLSGEQVREVYYHRMKEDFPASELKPLEMIEKCIKRGIYSCLGLFEGQKLAGYVYLIQLNRIYFADYLAVVPEFRGKGYGTRMLGLLGECLTDADLIFGEAEVPDCAENESERITRKRRVRFYLRAGLINTGIRVQCFGVPFVILMYPPKKRVTMDEVQKRYLDIYRLILPQDLFEANIRILENCSAGEQ